MPSSHRGKIIYLRVVIYDMGSLNVFSHYSCKQPEERSTYPSNHAMMPIGLISVSQLFQNPKHILLPLIELSDGSLLPGVCCGLEHLTGSGRLAESALLNPL